MAQIGAWNKQIVISLWWLIIIIIISNDDCYTNWKERLIGAISLYQSIYLCTVTLNNTLFKYFFYILQTFLLLFNHQTNAFKCTKVKKIDFCLSSYSNSLPEYSILLRLIFNLKSN